MVGVKFDSDPVGYNRRDLLLHLFCCFISGYDMAEI